MRVHDRFDIVIIGSGAGGGTLAYALSDTPARILLIERGDFVPQEDQNWSPEAVWKHRRYRTPERWLDERGREFSPYMHYSVGGNTKFWGSVLFRLRREDFDELVHVDGVSPAWPIDYETLAPYYDRAEQLYSVHGEVGLDPTEPPRGPYPFPPIPHEPRIAEIVEKIRAEGLHPSPLPLGLRDGCILCRTCNSFPCKIRAKSDAEVCGVRPALERPGLTLWTRTYARRLMTNGRGDRIEAVEVTRDGEARLVGADLFIVSCGAVNSAALLLRSATDKHRDGLANSSGLVGRRYMAHHATMIGGFYPPRNETIFQKTVAINDFYLRGPDVDYPLGQIQSQGRVAPVVVKYGGPPKARRVPLWMYAVWLSRGFEWLAISEDLPNPENRVVVTSDGRIQLRYRASNVMAHQRLVEETKRLLRRVGFWYVHAESLGTSNTSHQCGTLCFGTDPRTSVLDPFCRTHDIGNLFVVDASFFPSSAAVNPGLTIVAQALRVADHIKTTDLRLGEAPL